MQVLCVQVWGVGAASAVHVGSGSPGTSAVPSVGAGSLGASSLGRFYWRCSRRRCGCPGVSAGPELFVRFPQRFAPLATSKEASHQVCGLSAKLCTSEQGNALCAELGPCLV